MNALKHKNYPVCKDFASANFGRCSHAMLLADADCKAGPKWASNFPLSPDAVFGSITTS